MRGLREKTCSEQGGRSVKQGNPVHPRGFHDDRGAPTGGQPIGQPLQVTGKRTQCLDGLGIAIGGHTDPRLLSPDLDAGGMWVDDGHSLGSGRVLLACFRHTFLQSGAERGEPGKRDFFYARIHVEGARYEGRDCFILIEPARSVGGTLTLACRTVSSTEMCGRMNP